MAAVPLQGTMLAVGWPEADGALLRAGQEGQRPQDGREMWTHCLPRAHVASASTPPRVLGEGCSPSEAPHADWGRCSDGGWGSAGSTLLGTLL